MQPTDHTSRERGTYSDSWGTPAWIIDLVRETYGGIAIDMASNATAQATVQATERWYSADDPCPAQLAPPPDGAIYCNPPGPCKRAVKFWRTWCDVVELGARGAFLIFKQDHWRQLTAPPIDLVCVVFRRRLKFAGAGQGASFPSTLVLTPNNRVRELWSPHGHLTIWLHC